MGFEFAFGDQRGEGEGEPAIFSLSAAMSFSCRRVEAV
jgi:hypothetical protein